MPHSPVLYDNSAYEIEEDCFDTLSLDDTTPHDCIHTVPIEDYTNLSAVTPFLYEQDNHSYSQQSNIEFNKSTNKSNNSNNNNNNYEQPSTEQA